MALPDVAALKRYLKIEHTADDTLIDELRTRAIGLIQRFIGCPITKTERVFYDEAKWPSLYSAPKSLIIPKTPVETSTVAIEDTDGNALTLADLRIDAETGIVRFLDGSSFPYGPYKLTVKVGLDVLSEYTSEIEPVVGAALVDTVADLYLRRNPAALSESSSGVTRAYESGSGLPPRVEEALNNGIRRPL